MGIFLNVAQGSDMLLAANILLVFTSVCPTVSLSTLDLRHGHVQHVHHVSGWANQVPLCCHLRLSCYGLIQLHQRVRTIMKHFSSLLMYFIYFDCVLILWSGGGENREKRRFRSCGRVCLKVKFKMKTWNVGVKEGGQTNVVQMSLNSSLVWSESSDRPNKMEKPCVYCGIMP